MHFTKLAILPVALASLAACESEAERQADATEDRIEREAEQSAVAAGDAEAALGLTEQQLLDADLVAGDGTELGDVEQVRRNAAGEVSELLIEIEDSDPDRFVTVPIDDLSVIEGSFLNDADLQTNLTAQDLAKMPDASIDAQ